MKKSFILVMRLFTAVYLFASIPTIAYAGSLVCEALHSNAGARGSQYINETVKNEFAVAKVSNENYTLIISMLNGTATAIASDKYWGLTLVAPKAHITGSRERAFEFQFGDRRLLVDCKQNY